MKDLRELFEKNRFFRSTGRFIMVGAMGTIIDVFLFSSLRLLFAVPVLIANTLSSGIGMGNNFYFHRNWTFADQRDKPARKQFSKFFAVNLSSLAISNMMVLLLTPSLYSMLPDPAMGNLLVKGCASGAGMCFNFVANQLWTFRDTRRI